MAPLSPIFLAVLLILSTPETFWQTMALMGSPCQPQEDRDSGPGLRPFLTALLPTISLGAPSWPSPHLRGFACCSLGRGQREASRAPWGVGSIPGHSRCPIPILSPINNRRNPRDTNTVSLAVPGPLPRASDRLCRPQSGRPPFRVSKGWGQGSLSHPLPRGMQGLGFQPVHLGLQTGPGMGPLTLAGTASGLCLPHNSGPRNGGKASDFPRSQP